MAYATYEVKYSSFASLPPVILVGIIMSHSSNFITTACRYLRDVDICEILFHENYLVFLILIKNGHGNNPI